MATGGKDVYYRAKNREDIGWRKLLTNVVKRFVKIVANKGEPTEGNLFASILILEKPHTQGVGL